MFISRGELKGPIKASKFVEFCYLDLILDLQYNYIQELATKALTLNIAQKVLFYIIVVRITFKNTSLVHIYSTNIVKEMSICI